MDVCRYPRFRRPGHRATGDRSQRDRHWMRPETRVGEERWVSSAQQRLELWSLDHASV
jgi:hypothetical protein